MSPQSGRPKNLPRGRFEITYSCDPDGNAKIRRIKFSDIDSYRIAREVITDAGEMRKIKAGRQNAAAEVAKSRQERDAEIRQEARAYLANARRRRGCKTPCRCRCCSLRAIAKTIAPKCGLPFHTVRVRLAKMPLP